MNPRYIPNTWRKLVRERAFFLCEYCLIHEDDTILTCPIDHVISLKHGGVHHPDNLAYCCIFCNRSKGADVATVLPDQRAVRFFNPRIDAWATHFELDGALILPKSEIGEATAKILNFNEVERVMERQELIEEGRYPHLNALRFIRP